MNIKGFKQQHKRHCTAFLPHGALFVAQALSRFETERMIQGLGLKHVEQGLFVDITKEPHEPVVGSVAVERHHEREQFGNVR